jgi:hypothetical protein
MPLTTVTKILGINDIKISKLTVDDGTTLTYQTSVDVPGSTSLKLGAKFVEKELRGDEVILDRYTKIDSIDFSFDHAKVSLDVLNVILGGTTAAAGTTPAQTQTYTLKGTDIPNYFKIEGQSKYTDAGDVHIILYKCKINKFDYELKGEDYASVSISGTAIPTAKDSKIKDVIINETAAAIV